MESQLRMAPRDDTGTKSGLLMKMRQSAPSRKNRMEKKNHMPFMCRK